MADTSTEEKTYFNYLQVTKDGTKYYCEDDRAVHDLTTVEYSADYSVNTSNFTTDGLYKYYELRYSTTFENIHVLPIATTSTLGSNNQYLRANITVGTHLINGNLFVGITAELRYPAAQDDANIAGHVTARITYIPAETE